MPFFFTLLYRYFLKNLFAWLLIVCSIVLCIVFAFEFTELLRRSTLQTTVSFFSLIEMAFLKLPYHWERLSSFFVFLGILLGFRKLNQHNEFLILKACGVSSLQITSGLVLFVFSIISFDIFIINPISTIFRERFLKLEEKIFNTTGEKLFIVGGKLWLRETLPTIGKRLLCSDSFNFSNGSFKGIRIFYFDVFGKYTERLEAKYGFLKDNFWDLQEVYRWNQEGLRTYIKRISLPSQISIKNLEKAQIHPETIPLLKIPPHIRSLEKYGFPVYQYWIFLLSYLSKIATMILTSILAFFLSITQIQQRFNNFLKPLFQGISICLIVYFAQDLLFALVKSEKISMVVGFSILPVSLGVFLLSYLNLRNE